MIHVMITPNKINEFIAKNRKAIYKKHNQLQAITLAKHKFDSGYKMTPPE